MTKAKKLGFNMFFLVLVSAVVILAGFVVMTKFMSEGVDMRVEGAKSERLDTAADMMKALQMTNDDGGKAEMQQLKNDVSGL